MKSVMNFQDDLLKVLLVSRKFRERDPTEEILKAFRLFDDDKDGMYRYRRSWLNEINRKN